LAGGFIVNEDDLNDEDVFIVNEDEFFNDPCPS